MSQPIQINRHLANIITLTRILGVGIIFWITPYTSNVWLLWTIIIYTIICLTDILDGWVARRFKIVTDIGKVLDPLADKILVLVFLPLLEMQAITAFPVFIILAREFTVMALRVFSAKDGTIIAAKLSGKIKTAITLPVCGILFARVPVSTGPVPAYLEPIEWLRNWIFHWPTWSFNWLIWLTVLVTVWSCVDYFESFIWQRMLKNAKGNEDTARKQIRTLIPNTLSFLNLGSGAIAIGLAVLGNATAAVGWVLLGIFFDAFDGKLARKLNAVSEFGEWLDSKADLVSFGIAPGVILSSYLITLSSSPFLTGFAVGIGVIFFIAVQFRLKRFNETGHSGYFEGLPSPIGAAVVLIACISPFLDHYAPITVITLMTAYMMISKIRYAHLEIASRNRVLKLCRIPTLIFMVLTMLSTFSVISPNLFHTHEVLLCLIGVYLISPLFNRAPAPQ